MGKIVCVTGASGFIASWLVKSLLLRGYTVKATIRNLCDPSKVAHLKALDGADERLHLFEADLLEEGSFDCAVDGCEGVFHTASPVAFATSDPQLGIISSRKYGYENHCMSGLSSEQLESCSVVLFKTELIDPAVKGTMNVLKSCAKVSTIKRVVVTSSMASVMYNYDSLKQGSVVDETWFTDPIFCKDTKEWYALSKTLAEKATWKFAKENGLDLVTLHPGFTIGPSLQPTLNLTYAALLNLVKEGKQLMPNGVYRYVDVRDIAHAHVLALENSSASGRYCVVGRVAYWFEVVDILKSLFPSLSLPPVETENRPSKLPFQVSKERAESLGVCFRPLEETLKDSVESFRARNLIYL